MNPLKQDPTRTTGLRNAFMTDYFKRLHALKGAIIKLIVTDDAFGLKDRKEQKPGAVFNKQFAFKTDPEKVAAFEGWLDDQVNAGLLEVKGDGEGWHNKYIESSYKKGVVRSYVEANKLALADQATLYEGGQAQFLADAFGGPEAAQKIKLLSTRSFEYMKGLSAEAKKQLNVVLADGIAQGHGVKKIASNMNKQIGSINKKRARVIARTEIIHAHAEGQLDSFEALGVTELGVMAEWHTAGDDKVCALCGPLAGIVITVKEARGMIPRHPNCRCGWIPANVGEPTTDQTWSADEISAKVRESLKAELPKVKDAKALKKLSRWLGATKKFKWKGNLKPKVGPNPFQTKARLDRAFIKTEYSLASDDIHIPKKGSQFELTEKGLAKVAKAEGYTGAIDIPPLPTKDTVRIRHQVNWIKQAAKEEAVNVKKAKAAQAALKAKQAKAAKAKAGALKASQTKAIKAAGLPDDIATKANGGLTDKAFAKAIEDIGVDANKFLPKLQKQITDATTLDDQLAALKGVKAEAVLQKALQKKAAEKLALSEKIKVGQGKGFLKKKLDLPEATKGELQNKQYAPGKLVNAVEDTIGDVLTEAQEITLSATGPNTTFATQWAHVKPILEDAKKKAAKKVKKEAAIASKKVKAAASDKNAIGVGVEVDAVKVAQQKAGQAAPGASLGPKQIHPDDDFFDDFLKAAKTISHHADDKNFNTAALAAYKKAKNKVGTAIAKGGHDPDTAAMLAHYADAAKVIDAAKQAGTKLKAGTLSKFEYQPVVKPLKAGDLLPKGQGFKPGSTFKVTKTNLGGSTGAKKVEVSEGGLNAKKSDWILKDYSGRSEQAENEYLANGIYNLVQPGSAPTSRLATIKNGKGTSTGVFNSFQEGGKEIGTLKGAARTAANKKAKDGFVLDAWLGNWDAVGLGGDNMMVVGGKLVRIDNGGSLLYRAQGGLKGAAFGDKVDEVKTLLDTKTNPNAAKVFKGLTQKQIAKQIDQLETAVESQGGIDSFLSVAGLGDITDEAARATLRKTLTNRFNNLLALRDEVNGLSRVPLAQRVNRIKEVQVKKRTTQTVTKKLEANRALRAAAKKHKHGAAKNFTSNAYSKINRDHMAAVRKGEVGTKQTQQINEELANLPGFKGVLGRGQDNVTDAQFKAWESGEWGQVWWTAPSSSSAKPSRVFRSGDNGVAYIILSKGKRNAWVQDISHFSGEHEALFMGESVFKVRATATGAKKVNGHKRFVVLEELDAGEVAPEKQAPPPKLDSKALWGAFNNDAKRAGMTTEGNAKGIGVEALVKKAEKAQ